MYKFAVKSVLELYGIEYRRILEPEKGYRNEIWPVVLGNGDIINTTFFKSEPEIIGRIHRSNAVSEFLSLRGLPTRKRIDDRIMSLKLMNQQVYIGVYNYLAGETIPWEAYTMKHIKALGATMSNMHSLLIDMPDAKFPSVYAEYLGILNRMIKYFTQDGVLSAMSKKLGLKIDVKCFNDYVKLLEKYQQMSGQQPLHMDFVRGNILFSGAEITGILDFEKTALGHPIMDVSRTLAFLLVDCKFKTADKVIKYFLRSGYIKRGANKDVGDESDLRDFVIMFMLYDFYKFLLHNPYESLCDNEHYIRTKDILVSSAVISLK